MTAPPCGSCDAEHAASAFSSTSWTSAAKLDEWKPQFVLQSPDTYRTEYLKERSACRWSNAVSLFEHMKEYMRADYTFKCADEGGDCYCASRIYYGQRWQNGTALTTLAAMEAAGTW